MLRCLIVDDNDYFLSTARCLLERQGVAVVGVASDSAQALLLAEQLRPDVALVDINLGSECGFDVALRLQDESDPSALLVILISSQAEDDYADLIEASPAVGFLSKTALSGEAIGAVLAGAATGRRHGPVTGPPGR